MINLDILRSAVRLRLAGGIIPFFLFGGVGGGGHIMLSATFLAILMLI